MRLNYILHSRRRHVWSVAQHTRHGRSRKVNPSHASLLRRGVFGHGGIGNARGSQTVGFDLSFVNTGEKVANLVMIRVGHTDFAKMGMFTPGAVIAWRTAAKSGSDIALRSIEPTGEAPIWTGHVA